MLTLKAEPARQLVDNAYLSWTWSVLRAVFVLKARPSWVKLKRHEWKCLRGFTVRGLFNQTNKQTNKRDSSTTVNAWRPCIYSVTVGLLRLRRDAPALCLFARKPLFPLFVWLNKPRTVKPLGSFHSWRLSFTQYSLAFSTKTARRTLQVQLR